MEHTEIRDTQLARRYGRVLGNALPADVPSWSVDLHGFKTSTGVAEVLSKAHAGILTSEFEGMPFSVLESLGTGRPVCAIELPRLASVIKSGVSGALVRRSSSQDDMADRLANAFVEVAGKIRSGSITPEGVASAISEFTPERQFARVYERHRRLQQRRFGLAA